MVASVTVISMGQAHCCAIICSCHGQVVRPLTALTVFMLFTTTTTTCKSYKDSGLYKSLKCQATSSTITCILGSCYHKRPPCEVHNIIKFTPKYTEYNTCTNHMILVSLLQLVPKCNSFCFRPTACFMPF